MQKVGTTADLSSGKPIRATVDGKKILVFLVEDKPVATAARCPHAHGPLHEGEICGSQLICPWHGWTFDLPSGACEEDPALFLETYTVVCEGDDLLVSVHADA
jgi:nitrite reductase (NADH) small subunit